MADQEPRSRFPKYWCHIYQPTQGVDILADLAEEFSYAAVSHFEGPVGTSSGEIASIIGNTPILGSLANAAAKAAGGDAAIQYLTKRIWTGTDPIQFNLKLLFDAENNTLEDVHRCLTILAAMALPSQVGNTAIMVAPNPYRGFITSMGEFNKISIRIGKQYYFDSVVIMAATPAVDTRLDDVGYPLAGAIDLQVCTDYVYHKNDLYHAASITPPTPFNSGASNRFEAGPSKLMDTPKLSPVQLLKSQYADE